MTARHADLATRLAALDPVARAQLRERLAARPRLTPAQRRLWQAPPTTDGRRVDLVCQAVRLSGAQVDLDLLAARVTAFAGRHEALRTTFAVTGDTIEPVVHASLPPLMRRLRCADQADAEHQARLLADEPLDLAAGPLLRVGLAAGPAPDLAWLLVAVPNLVFDAWSFELLLDWLAAPAAGDQPPAPPFAAFAAEQARYLGSADGSAAAAYWAGVLRDPPAPLPVARPRSAAATDGGRVDFILPAGTAAAVAAAARAEGATPFAGWLAVFAATLAEFGGNPDVVVGTFTANRDRPGTTDMVGYLLNVLPVRVRGADPADHRATTRLSRDAFRAALRHAAYPGELLPGRGVPYAHPWCDAVFVFENLSAGNRSIHGAAVRPSDVDRSVARYELTLSVRPEPHQVTCWLEYDTARHTGTTASTLADGFAALAEKVAAA
jgi:Condensation domain